MRAAGDRPRCPGPTAARTLNGAELATQAATWNRHRHTGDHRGWTRGCISSTLGSWDGHMQGPAIRGGAGPQGRRTCHTQWSWASWDGSMGWHGRSSSLGPEILEKPRPPASQVYPTPKVQQAPALEDQPDLNKGKDRGWVSACVPHFSPRLEP